MSECPMSLASITGVLRHALRADGLAPSRTSACTSGSGPNVLA